MKEKYLIIGFSGAGKTHLLEKLKKRGERGSDLDNLVLIPYPSCPRTRDLIKEVGVEAFREREFLELKQWFLSSEENILALGGGTLENKNLVAWLSNRDDWACVYLNESFETCWKRLNQRGESFLIDLGYEKSKALYTERKKVFESFKDREVYLPLG